MDLGKAFAQCDDVTGHQMQVLKDADLDLTRSWCGSRTSMTQNRCDSRRVEVY